MVPALFLFLAASTLDDSFRAGLLALQHNDLALARTSLEAAVKANPSNGRAWVALSQTYRKLKQQKEADDAARRAISAAPNDGVVADTLALSYFESAQPLLRQERFPEAIAVLEPASKLLPGSAQIELALGVSYYGTRRFNDAAGAFLRTIDLTPETVQPYVFLGKFLDQIPGRIPEIAGRFAAYAEAHPDRPEAYYLQARLLDAQSTEPERAETLLRKAIAIDSADPNSHFELGSVLDRLGHYENAAAEFAKSAALNPASPETHYRLARDYQRLGRTEEAAAELERHARLLERETAAK